MKSICHRVIALSLPMRRSLLSSLGNSNSRRAFRKLKTRCKGWLPLVVTIMTMAAFAAAQDIRIPESGINNRMRTDLRVDPVSHALQFQIPLGDYPGRAGLNMPVTLYYSSKVWNLRYINSIRCGDDPGSLYLPEYAKHSVSGWTSSLGGVGVALDISLQRYDSHTTRPTTRGDRQIARKFIILPDGSRHEVRKDDNFHEPDENITGLFYSVDGSRLIYDTVTGILLLPDGSRYLTHEVSGQIYVDRNGNKLSYSSETRRWSDTLGRSVANPLPPLQGDDGLSATEQDYTYSIPGFGGTSLTYTLRWRRLSSIGVINEQETDQTLRYKGDRISNCSNISGDPALFHSSPVNFDGGVSKQGIFDPVVLYQIVLPTGQSYTFKYNIYGEITKVIYPTGGYERFAYGEAPLLSAEDGVGIYSQGNRGVNRAWISPDGTTANEGTLTPWRYDGFNTIAPDGTYTERSVFTNIYDWSAYAFEDPRLGMVYDERSYSAGGQLLRRKLTEYAVDGQVVMYSYPAYKQRNPRPSKVLEIVLDPDGTALAVLTEMTYDSDINLTSTKHYDYASVNQATAQTGDIVAICGNIPNRCGNGTILRTEETDYLTYDQNYRDRNLLSLPTATRIRNEDGTIVAQTSTSYDETDPPSIHSGVTGWSYPGTARGNATTTKRWLNFNDNTFSTFPLGSYLVAHAEYDQFGNMVKIWDAQDTSQTNPTQMEYSSDYQFVYATTVRSAVPDPSGQFASNTSLVTTTVYDGDTGLVTSTTDPNSRTTTFSYIDPQTFVVDALNRIRTIAQPDGGLTTYNYNDTPGSLSIQTLTKQDSSRSIDTIQAFDGLGRPSRSFLNVGGGNYNTSDTQYDVIGRIARVSNPYVSSGPGSTINATQDGTTRAYDALGRITSLTTTSDGARVMTAYGLSTTDVMGTTVTVSDQAQKVRRSLIDALGRMIRIDEPNTFGDMGSVASPTQATSYRYDVLGNLRKVTQGNQERFFAFDSLSRLLRTRNPETGVNPHLVLTDSMAGNSQWSIAYSYDNNGNLITRTDARNITSTFSHDALNRNTRVTYTSDPANTAGVSQFYDGFRGNVDNQIANSKGRRWQTETGGPNGSRMTITSFDSLGRPREQNQQFYSNNDWSEPYTVERMYDLAGHVTWQQYPSRHTVTYNYDTAGRLGDMDPQNLAFSGNLGDGNPRTYSRGITYSLFGGLSQEQFGTDTAIYNKLAYNSRGQLAEIKASTAPNDSSWNRGKFINWYSVQCGGANCDASNNNGNLRKQETAIPNNEQNTNPTSWYQEFNYDQLNRLERVHEYTGDTALNWQQEYVYDRYGNRTIDGNPSKTFGAGINNLQTVVSTATNRMYGPNETDANHSLLDYDAAGNQTKDLLTSGPGNGTRVYDAENRVTIARDANENQIAAYTYNADGQRVRRSVSGQAEAWQIYGMDGELLAEYAADTMPASLKKEYGYRNGQLLITAEAAVGSVPGPALTAIAPGSVALSWSAVSGASNYRVERKAANGNYLEINTTSGTSMTDSGASPGSAYLYRVCAANGSGNCTSNYSNVELGAPLNFPTDPNIVGYSENPAQATRLNANHITELRAAINAVRHLAGKADAIWSHPANHGDLIAVEDVRELRVQLDEALGAMGLQTPPYLTDPVLKSFQEDALNATPIKVAHIRELRLRATSAHGQGDVKLQTVGATASQNHSAPYDASHAINGNLNDLWSAGAFAPQWIQVDLGQAKAISRVRLLVDQLPDGHTTHEVYGGATPDTLTLLGTFDGDTSFHQWLELSSTASNIRYIKVSTTASPSWVGWAEIEVYGPAASNVLETRWVVADQLGTPRIIVDQTGSLAGVSRHDYLPFGEELSAGLRSTTPGYTNNDGFRQKFTLKERDNETGLDYFISRYYSSVQGRFTSADALLGKRRDPQSLNRYAYVLNNPLKFIDPLGYLAQDPKKPQKLPEPAIIEDVVIINIGKKKPPKSPPTFLDIPFPGGAKFCIAGKCDGESLRQVFNRAGTMITSVAASTERSIRQMAPDSVQLNITGLWVISGTAGITVDGDIFAGVESPIFGGWTNIIGDGVRSARTGTDLTARSGFGINLTGTYIIDPATRDSQGAIITGSDAAAAARKSFVSGPSWGGLVCYQGACGGGQKSNGRYGVMMGMGTPGFSFGPSYSGIIIPKEKLPSFSIPK